jgi:hypothetical protein
VWLQRYERLPFMPVLAMRFTGLVPYMPNDEEHTEQTVKGLNWDILAEELTIHLVDNVYEHAWFADAKMMEGTKPSDEARRVLCWYGNWLVTNDHAGISGPSKPKRRKAARR